MVLVCGIDEAGRGPVIGPLVTVGVLVEEKDEPKLKALGVKDSKLLTPVQRESLFSKIIAIIKDYKVVILKPFQIDAALNDPDLNLNWLEANTMADICNALKPDRLVVDCPSNNIKAFTDYLEGKIKSKTKIVAEHKADKNHMCVAAASIIAKVTRDREIEDLHRLVGEDFGSGYPADPVTQKFLKENFRKHPGIFRKTWASYQKLLDNKKQKSLSDF